MLILLCQCLREACEFALEEKLFLDTCSMEGFSDEATIAHSAQFELLRKVFTKAAEDDTATEVCYGNTCMFPKWLIFKSCNYTDILAWLCVSGARLPAL